MYYRYVNRNPYFDSVSTSENVLKLLNLSFYVSFGLCGILASTDLQKQISSLNMSTCTLQKYNPHHHFISKTIVILPFLLFSIKSYKICKSVNTDHLVLAFTTHKTAHCQSNNNCNTHCAFVIDLLYLISNSNECKCSP